MKKILFSLLMVTAFTLAVSAQDVKKECHETTKKESCEHKDKKEGCCAENKEAKSDKKADCEKSEAKAQKSCGKK